MQLVFIGLIIGMMMGLTGAGGALIAIPLFMSLLEQNLKVASVLSLYVVILASIINFIFQRKNADYKLATIVFMGSVLGSFASRPLKEISSDLLIATILSIVSLFSLYQVWKNKTQSNLGDVIVSLPKSFALGFVLGILTTMTGLGGGVLLIPFFLGIFKLSESKAVATSLLIIAFSSLVSLLLQLKNLEKIFSLIELAFLVTGILSSLYGLKLVLKLVSPQKISFLRKLIFTAIVIYSLSEIFNK